MNLLHLIVGLGPGGANQPMTATAYTRVEVTAEPRVHQTLVHPYGGSLPL